MLNLVKIFPGSFLFLSALVDPRTLEMPPEVPVGHIPLEN